MYMSHIKILLNRQFSKQWFLNKGLSNRVCQDKGCQIRVVKQEMSKERFSKKRKQKQVSPLSKVLKSMNDISGISVEKCLK